MVSLDNDTKKIIKAVIHSDNVRKKRKRVGRHTDFDTLAEVAINKAKEELLVEVEDKEVRNYIIDRIYTSLLYNTPWESLGETYCCRNLFYDYRTRFIYLVALHMGIIEGSRQQIVKRREFKI